MTLRTIFFGLNQVSEYYYRNSRSRSRSRSSSPFKNWMNVFFREIIHSILIDFYTLSAYSVGSTLRTVKAVMSFAIFSIVQRNDVKEKAENGSDIYDFWNIYRSWNPLSNFIRNETILVVIIAVLLLL